MKYATEEGGPLGHAEQAVFRDGVTGRARVPVVADGQAHQVALVGDVDGDAGGVAGVAENRKKPYPATTSAAAVGSATWVTANQARTTPRPIAASRPAPQRNIE